MSCDHIIKKKEIDCGGLTGPVINKVKAIGFDISHMYELVDSATCCTSVNPCYINYRGGYVKSNNLLFFIHPQTIQANLKEVDEDPLNFSLITSSYACSPAIKSQTDQKIIDMSVFSNNDFNNNYPANTNLVPLLDVKNDVNISLGTYLSNNDKDFLVNPTGLTFNTSPAAPSKHVLSFIVTLGDSSQLTFKSDTLKLN